MSVAGVRRVKKMGARTRGIDFAVAVVRFSCEPYNKIKFLHVGHQQKI